MKSELSRIANVQLLKKKSIISLISNVRQSSAVLEKVCMHLVLTNLHFISAHQCRSSLICLFSRLNLHRMTQVFRVFKKNDINVQMISQGASKVRLTFIMAASIVLKSMWKHVVSDHRILVGELSSHLPFATSLLFYSGALPLMRWDCT